MKPLIKWPGGKTNEIVQIKDLIPPFTRYVEPFFGGGALFFHLNPKQSFINDLSQPLMDYYRLIKAQDKKLYDYLYFYYITLQKTLSYCDDNYDSIFKLYSKSLVLQTEEDENEIMTALHSFCTVLVSTVFVPPASEILLNKSTMINELTRAEMGKFARTKKNNATTLFSPDDIKSNLITGFSSGFYTYFRSIFNDISLNRLTSPGPAYSAANFCFIREYCYGSMFRYNEFGEFNIPYGGISYNFKNFPIKIENMFNKEVKKIFKATQIHNEDFEAFIKRIKPTANDFMFIDPPYDSTFSDYEGNPFTTADQQRLANVLSTVKCKFIMIVKNTDFIKELYNGKFATIPFDNLYTCNVRCRNNRMVEHVVVTNLPIS